MHEDRGTGNRDSQHHSLPLRGVASLAAFAMLLAGCAAFTSMSGTSRDLRDAERRAPRGADLGQARLLFDDMGSLDTHSLESVASPWKLYSTALLISTAPSLGLPVEGASLRPVLEHFGFIFPDSIGNWDPRAGPQPHLDAPLGMTRANLHGLLPGIGLEARNNGCATCHSGRVYDAEGRPTRIAWAGLPNTSIDLEGYSAAVFAGLKLGMKDEKAFFEAIRHVHPGMGWGERYAYRHQVLPRLRRELPGIVAARDRALVFDNGGPGLTNGVAALKVQLDLISRKTFADRERGLTSIPDLSDRAFRTSLLWDGTYVVRGRPRFASVTRDHATREEAGRHAEIVSFFTIGTAGNTPATAESAIPRVREILQSLASYRPPPFPGPIDDSLAARGRDAFEARCSSCHGHYDRDLASPRLLEYPNRLVPQARIGTDSVRWTLVDDGVLGWQSSNPRHPFVRHVDAARTGGYVAPILSGLWITAPYLHNGSVPTIWHLMHPDQRPARFESGGHRLDYGKLGIALAPAVDGVAHQPADWTPISRSVVYDTSLPGRSNAGHEYPFAGIPEPEKRALLEYLKRL